MNQAYVVALLVLSLAAPAGLAAQATPRYTNAKIVSINAQTRLVVIKGTDGREETLKLDDMVTGLDVLRTGDRVMLTVRQEPGIARISAMARSQATPPSTGPATTPVVAVVGSPAVDPALKSFGDQVAALALQAGQVDSVWSNFKTACNVTLRSSYADGREWFSLWDGAAQIDVSAGSCRDLFNQIVAQGEAVKAGMAGAEEAARKAELSPGDLREVLRRHSMEWGGWGLPAPEPLKQ